jgi:hypothetical protein
LSDETIDADSFARSKNDMAKKKQSGLSISRLPMEDQEEKRKEKLTSVKTRTSLLCPSTHTDPAARTANNEPTPTTGSTKAGLPRMDVRLGLHIHLRKDRVGPRRPARPCA